MKGVQALAKIGRVSGSLSVEPAAFLLMSSIIMSHLVFKNFLMDRACRNDLNLGDDVCNAIAALNGSYRQQELEIQMKATLYRSYRSLIHNSFPILVLLLLGAWSDIHGRKIPMMLGISSVITQDLLMFATSMFWHNLGGLWISIIASIPACFTGSLMTFSMAAYAHISDTSSLEVRTVRLGILSACSSLGVPSGYALGGLVLKAKLGFPIAFLISSSMALVAMLIVVCRVTSTPKKPDNDPESDTSSPSVFRRFLDLCKGLIQVLFKPREGSDRAKLWLLLVVYYCIAVPIHGEFGVMYLYLRATLAWDAGNYGLFSVYNSLVLAVGMSVSMGILSRWLSLPDPVIGFIGGIGQIGACFVYAFGVKAGLIYLAPLVDMMNGTMYVVAKSMVSKIVQESEYGKTFTIFGVLGTLVPLAADPMYAFLYRMTIATSLPGAVFLLSAALTIPPQLVYGVMSLRSLVNTKEKVTPLSWTGYDGNPL